MKLKIYKEETEEKEKEKVVMLKLEQLEQRIRLIAVDEDGDRYLAGNLLFFYDDGTIIAPESVNKELGFNLNDDGSLKID